MTDVAVNLNMGRRDHNQISNRNVGELLSTMGLQKRIRFSDGRSGRIVTDKLLKRLEKRFGHVVKEDLSERYEDRTYRGSNRHILKSYTAS